MLRSFALLLLVYLYPFSAAAQAPAPDAAMPATLKDWRAWVLKDLDYRSCPFLATQAPNAPEAFLCAWPGRLSLNASADGANFSLHWRVEADSWVPLPGDAEHWPQQVTVNAQRQPVLTHAVGNAGASPALWLPRGSYEISGRIPWHERPQSLRVPDRIGLIALSVDGKPVAPIQRDNDQVTLGRSAAAAPEADSLQVRVYRKLADGVPGELTTQIQLIVSGQAREETIGPALATGFVPLALSGGWPARLDDDGRLHVQVQPGSTTLTLDARAMQPLATVTAHLPGAPWPKQEIWSYEAAPRLRVTSASGATQVDPHQAEVPNEWSALPAFALSDGGTIQIEQRSRGLAADEGNRLSLQREAWLDFSGGGWYARDRIRGQMVQGWRFDVAAPFTLERADAANSARRGSNGEALLVTRGAADGLSGVEWRTPAVDLAAGVRIARAAATSLPVAGWQQTFDRIDATLHLPFGYKLLGAPGADSVAGSWMSGWTLLDAFVCAILALLAWRLLGLAGAAITVVYLLLAYQESGSPLWSLLAVFALALIARALPAGKLERTAEMLRRVALVALVLIALPFVADQLRFTLYPQLEQAGYGIGNAIGYLARDEKKDMAPQRMEETMDASAPAATPPAEAMMKSRAKSIVDKATGGLQTVVATASNINRADLIDHYSESTVVQTGAGEPSWNLGSSASLSWSGPVLVSQSVRLLIAPPWLVRPLRVLLVALLAWLLWRLFGSGALLRRNPANAIGAALIVLAAIATTQPAQAQTYPSEELLQQLRQRLTEAPKCAPACASLAEAQIAANGDTISVALEAHAAERIALPMPRVDNATVLKSIKVDGATEESLVRNGDGTLWLALGRGVHRIELDYAASADKAALSFALKPARVLFQGNGWEASGLGDDRLLTETLNLARARASATGKPAVGVQQFPPYVRVDRSLSLGLDWSAATHVERMSPAQGGFIVEVPVLAGEHVWTSGVKVQNGKVPAAIGESEGGTNWQSTLDKGDALTLTAPALTDHAEVWHVLVSPTWHVDFSGVPGVGLDAGENGSDYRNFEFHPLPGETLTLKITRPAPVQGAMRAIDTVSFVSEAGQHASTRTLSFTLRASQGGEQTIALPADAEVLGVTRDRQTLNLRPQAGKLSLPIVPGTQRFEIRFRDPTQMSWFLRTPQVALGLPAANIGLNLQLPADRWLLAAFGPQVGPAVLYWGELAVMILVAFALARTRRTRLTFRDWLLLGLGFSTFSWGALLVVVAWLFAFDWRLRNTPSNNESVFNLTQIGLALLTMIALLCLISAIPQGLLGQPNMHVTGNGSSAQSLQWFADRSTDALPQASAVSLPLWVYKVLMLAWALWLANALIGWLRDGFAAWTKGGYWRQAPKKVVAQALTEAAVAEKSDPETT